MRKSMRSAVVFSFAGTLATLCLAVLGMACARNPHGLNGDAGAAGTTGSGGAALGGNTMGSGGVSGTGGCGAACSRGGDIILIDPYTDCGNGRQDYYEGCDDGNRVSSDGCDWSCHVEEHWTCPIWGQPCVPLCGNGEVDLDETCDDGNRLSGDGCSSDCQKIDSGWRCRVPGKTCSPVCGDSLLLGTELCDDGNATGGDGCSRACQVEPGYICRAPGEPCKPVPCAGTDGAAPCDAGLPSVSVCGDGIVSGNEECDDGSDPGREPHNDDNAYGGCTTACRLGPYCGDGVTNGPEACDDGLANLPSYGSPGCSFACQKAHYCGDGFIDTSHGEDCEPFPGYQNCMPDCHLFIGP
jgi:large repetitive protein